MKRYKLKIWDHEEWRTFYCDAESKENAIKIFHSKYPWFHIAIIENHITED